MFARLGNEAANRIIEGISNFMAEKTSSKAKKTQAKRATTEAKKSATASAKASKRAATQTIAAERNQVLTVAETAVDFPVGVVLSVSDRVSDLAAPWTGRSSAEKQIKAYRAQLRKSLKRTERRGSSARRKATTEARKTRNRVEREARKRQRSVETTLKRNRDEVERRVRGAIEEQASRGKGLVDQVTDQLSALR
jgi:F0F1-type ATP synthase membrane subunit b/b'